MAGGRKSKYHEYVEPRLDEILKWKKEGIKESAIADMLGIHIATFEVYKKKYSELNEVIKKGNIKIAEIAENSLIKGIRGEWIEETETIIEANGNKEPKKRVKKVRKYIPPNATLIIFALKNKDPVNWKDRQETHLSGGLNMEIVADYGELEDEDNS